MKKNALFTLFAILLTLFAACIPSEKTPASIYLETNSFASSYELEARLDFEEVRLRLVYTDGESNLMRCTEDMIKGFDTTTTGQKTLYAEYKGLKSNEITYQVYNPEGVSREVITPTRIVVTKTEYEDRTVFDFSLTSADITVRALTFRIQGTVELSDTLGEISGQALGEMDDFYWKKTASNGVNVLISSSKKGQCGGIFFTLTWTKTNVGITLSDVTVSDGIQDYYLPKVQ